MLIFIMASRGNSFYNTDKPQLKVVLLGQAFTGKTSLVEFYMYNRCVLSDKDIYKATIGAAYTSRVMEVAGKTFRLSIWDTAGAERYQAMSATYYRGANAAIICYDVTDGQSFDKVRYWVGELRAKEETCKIYLCGTKKDLLDKDKHARKVDYHNAQDYAEEMNAEFFETSSKTGEKIHELFFKIGIDFVKDPSFTTSQAKGIALDPGPSRWSKKCDC